MSERLFTSYTASVILCSVIAMYVSIFIAIILFIIFSIKCKKINWSGYLFVSLLIGIISFTNFSDIRDGDYDIIRYYTYWQNISQTDSLLEALVFIYTMSRDYGFYVFVYILTRIFPEDPRWFSFIISALTSFLIYLSFANFCNKIKFEFLVGKASSLLLFTLGFFCVIRFYDYTNALRQHFAFCLFMYIVSTELKLSTKLMMLIIVATFHWTISPLIVLYALFKYKDINKFKQNYILIIAFIIGTIGLKLLMFLFSGVDLAAGYITGEHQELGVDKRIMVIMALCTVIINKFCNNHFQNKDICAVSFIQVLNFRK